ncbi:MAG: hypothetical protein IJZ03_03720 [Clostridia bacterium]|nr:hypothetical protein [Clostridia bacterium]MBQ9749611.1 hypothetical protein [Clostridia bacterium]
MSKKSKDNNFGTRLSVGFFGFLLLTFSAVLVLSVLIDSGALERLLLKTAFMTDTLPKRISGLVPFNFLR